MPDPSITLSRRVTKGSTLRHVNFTHMRRLLHVVLFYIVRSVRVLLPNSITREVLILLARVRVPDSGAILVELVF